MSRLFLDFGFTLYATKKISENKTDKCKIEYIITAVTFIKVILAVCLGVVFLLFLYINVFDVTLMTILQVYLLGYLITALLPDFYYRGMENMKSIALRTLIVRVLFTLLIFLLCKEEGRYYVCPSVFFWLVAYWLSLSPRLIFAGKNRSPLDGRGENMLCQWYDLHFRISHPVLHQPLSGLECHNYWKDIWYSTRGGLLYIKR